MNAKSKTLIATYNSRFFQLLWAIPALNFGLLTYLTFRYAVDAPVWDQWDFLPTLVKSYRHELTFADLWAQHNEHRLIFPRLIMLALAHLSGWNLRWELAVSLLLALAIYAVHIYVVRRTTIALQIPRLMLVLPVIGLMVFSFRQSQNWNWGWQLQIFLNILAVVIGFAVLTQQQITAKRLVLAMVLGVIATYSFANGLLYWLAGAFVLLNVCCAENRRAYLAAWTAAAIFTGLSYFYHFTRPANSPSILEALHHPAQYGLYVAGYLGALYAGASMPVAASLGLLGLGLFASATQRLISTRSVPVEAIVPYLAYCLYAILSALMCGLGRVGFGAVQALESRYTTISQLFWIGTLVLVYMAAPPVQSPAGRANWNEWVLIITGMGVLFSSIKVIRGFHGYYDYLLPYQQQLQQSKIAPGNGLSYNWQIVHAGSATLKAYHLNIYYHSSGEGRVHQPQ